MVFGSVSASVALDDIGTGDAASTLATTAGNITIDAQGSDTDILFKMNAGGTNFTALTLDGSVSGSASFFHDLTLSNSGAFILHATTSVVNASYQYNFIGYAWHYHKTTNASAGVFARFDNSAGAMVGYISFNNTATAFVTSSNASTFSSGATQAPSSPLPRAILGLSLIHI